LKQTSCRSALGQRISFTRTAAPAALAIGALVLAACGGGAKDSASTPKGATGGDADGAGATSVSAAATESKGGQSIAGKKILFIHANDAGNVFDKPVIAGSDAAAALTGLKVDTQFSNNDDKQLRSIFQSGVAEKVAGIIVSIPDASLNKPICAARQAGIPVVAWNVNGVTGAARDCVMAFLGQDFVKTGAVVGDRMIKDGLIKQGAKVFCPVEYPNSDYAAQRAAGVNQALKAVGAKCDVVGVGADQAKAKTTMVQYLLGHRDTNAIVSLGGTPNSVAVAAAKQAGVSDLKLGGFDLTKQIIDGIREDKIAVTADQQPYSQGFFAVMQMATYLQFGLFPSDMATGGTGLVDKTNVDFVQSLVPDYR
jgi:simple sugar transport system substrate-binding protein